MFDRTAKLGNRPVFSKRSAPVSDDIISLWMSYPDLSRCQELREIMDLVFGLPVAGTYNPGFADDPSVAMSTDTLKCNLHLVRSWFGKSFAGHTRQS